MPSLPVEVTAEFHPQPSLAVLKINGRDKVTVEGLTEEQVAISASDIIKVAEIAAKIYDSIFGDNGGSSGSSGSSGSGNGCWVIKAPDGSTVTVCPPKQE